MQFYLFSSIVLLLFDWHLMPLCFLFAWNGIIFFNPLDWHRGKDRGREEFSDGSLTPPGRAHWEDLHRRHQCPRDWPPWTPKQNFCHSTGRAINSEIIINAQSGVWIYNHESPLNSFAKKFAIVCQSFVKHEKQIYSVKLAQV